MKTESDVTTVYEAILARRSVREYTPQKVDAKMIRSLIEAAVMAPTAMHSEPWSFVIIQDTQLLKELSDVAKPMFIKELKQNKHDFDAFRSPEFNVFYDASTLIVICANKNIPFADADCWLAAENLMLAACGMKLGSCVIGAALSAINKTEKKLQLGMSEGYDAIAPIVVGFPKKTAAASQRKRPLILSWFEDK